MRTMSILAVVFVLITAIPEAAQAEGESGFQLKLFGGASYHLLGDFSECLKGWNDGVEASPYSHIENGEFSPFHLGGEFGVEVLLPIKRRLGIGLGTGLVLTGKESLRVSALKSAKLAPYEFYEEKLNPGVRAIPITLSLHLDVYSHNRLNISAIGGVGLYFGTVRWKYQYSKKSSPELYKESWTGTSGGLGLHGGVELEFKINRRLGFFIEGMGRYARLTGFQGDFLAGGKTEEDALLWYTEWGQFPGFVIDADEPTGGIYENVRKAVIDLSGFSVRVGLKVRWGDEKPKQVQCP